ARGTRGHAVAGRSRAAHGAGRPDQRRAAFAGAQPVGGAAARARHAAARHPRRRPRGRRAAAAGQRPDRHARTAGSGRWRAAGRAHRHRRRAPAGLAAGPGMSAPGDNAPRAETAIRIALADDQALVRSGLKALLAGFDRIRVVLEAGDGEALLAALVHTPVDVVLSDIRMPGMDGFALVRALRQRGDATPVVLLTTFDDDALPLRAAEAGAQGFLLKDASPEDLYDAVVRVVAGETLLQPVSTDPVRARFRFRDDAPPMDTFNER